MAAADEQATERPAGRVTGSGVTNDGADALELVVPPIFNHDLRLGRRGEDFAL
jgi:hypothetical protein